MTTAHQIQFAIKGYATVENARRAVEQVYGKNHEHFGTADVQWLIAVTPEGRFLPVFIGERAVRLCGNTKFAIAA